MSAEAIGKNKTRMNGYPVSWNQANHQKSAERRARLIQKIYEVDPLTCPKCSGTMKVISVIEDQDVIKKILQRRTSPQAPRSMGAHAQAPATDGQITAPMH